jgi:ribosomal protein S28E/S33
MELSSRPNALVSALLERDQVLGLITASRWQILAPEAGRSVRCAVQGPIGSARYFA